eukprot:6242503-Prymnesium_polylepis.1
MHTHDHNHVLHVVQQQQQHVHEHVAIVTRRPPRDCIVQDPAARLGNVNNGDDIKTHEFFQSLEWEKLLSK